MADSHSDVILNLVMKGKDAGARKALGDVRGEARTTETALERLGHAGQKAGHAIKTGMHVAAVGIKAAFTAGAAGGIGMGFIDRWALGAASQVETFRAKLITATKDIGKAAGLMAWATKKAAETPFELPQVIDTVVRLMNYRMPVAQWFELIGNMAGAMGRDITDAVEAVADAVSGGGLERLKEFGISASQLKEWGYIGNYTAEGIESMKKALQGILTERFAGGMKAMMDTITGKVSNFKDSIFWLALAIGQRIAPTFKHVLDEATKIIDVFAKSSGAQSFGDWLAKGMHKAWDWLKNFINTFYEWVPKAVMGALHFGKAFVLGIGMVKQYLTDLKTDFEILFENASWLVVDWGHTARQVAADVGEAIATAVEGKTGGGGKQLKGTNFPGYVVGSGSGLLLSGTHSSGSSLIEKIGKGLRLPEHLISEWLQKRLDPAFRDIADNIKQGARQVIGAPGRAVGGIRDRLEGALGNLAGRVRGATAYPAGDEARYGALELIHFARLATLEGQKNQGWNAMDKTNSWFDKLGTDFLKFWGGLTGPATPEAHGLGAPSPMGPRPEHMAYLRGRAKYGGAPSQAWGRMPGIDFPVPGQLGPIAGVFAITNLDRGRLDLAQQARF
jgi:hypothetical protein